MKKITIRAELASDDEAESVEIRITQGAVVVRCATVQSDDAAASFDMEDGDYVARAFVAGAGRQEVSALFAVPGQDRVTLQVP